MADLIECVYTIGEKSSAVVHTKPRGIEAACIISGNRGTHKFTFPVQATKNLAVAQESGYNNLCVSE